MFKRLLNGLGLGGSTPSLTHDDLPPGEQPVAESEQAGPVDVTDADFDRVVGQAETLAVVDFWADWCAPCNVMSAYVGFLAKEYGDRMVVAALDVDDNPETSARYNVMGLPTLLFLRNGQEVDRQVGLSSYDALKARVEELLAAAEQP